MCVQIFIIFLFRVLGEILVEESYILHVRSWMTKSSYSMTSKSNGYYRERASSKDNLARMGVRVLYPTCVQIFIIFLFRGLGGILVEEESYILHIRSWMTESSYSTMSRSNGYYKRRTPKKARSFIMWWWWNDIRGVPEFIIHVIKHQYL
jgi:hypothetical protein